MQFRSFAKKVSLGEQLYLSFHKRKLVSTGLKRSFRFSISFLVILSLGWLTACKMAEGFIPTGNNNVVLRLHGSNTVGAEFAPALIEEFLKKKKKATGIKRIQGEPEEMIIEAVFEGESSPKRIEIKAHGSDTAVKSLEEGKCDIGMLSRKMKAEEVEKLSKLGDMKARGAENVIALDGIAVIVNKGNQLRDLSLKQIADIFTGGVKNWSEVKSNTATGKDGAINVYARDDKSGTYDTFKSLVLGKEKKLVGEAKRFEDSKELSDKVAADPNGIGFVGLPYIGGSEAVSVYEEGVKPLKPAERTIKTREYLLHRELYFYLPQNNKNDLARELVEFAIDDDGQEVAKDKGFVSQKIDEQSVPPPVPQEIEGLPSALVEIKKTSKEFPTRFYFQTGGSILDNKSLDDFDRIVEFFNKEGANECILVGYSDSKGTDDKNIPLSVQRAETVKKEFDKVGMKCKTNGFGKANPIANNDKEEGREKNRRVEIYYK